MPPKPKRVTPTKTIARCLSIKITNLDNTDAIWQVKKSKMLSAEDAVKQYILLKTEAGAAKLFNTPQIDHKNITAMDADLQAFVRREFKKLCDIFKARPQTRERPPDPVETDESDHSPSDSNVAPNGGEFEDVDELHSLLNIEPLESKEHEDAAVESTVESAEAKEPEGISVEFTDDISDYYDEISDTSQSDRIRRSSRLREQRRQRETERQEFETDVVSRLEFLEGGVSNFNELKGVLLRFDELMKTHETKSSGHEEELRRLKAQLQAKQNDYNYLKKRAEELNRLCRDYGLSFRSKKPLDEVGDEQARRRRVFSERHSSAINGGDQKSANELLHGVVQRNPDVGDEIYGENRKRAADEFNKLQAKRKKKSDFGVAFVIAMAFKTLSRAGMQVVRVDGTGDFEREFPGARPTLKIVEGTPGLKHDVGILSRWKMSLAVDFFFSLHEHLSTELMHERPGGFSVKRSDKPDFVSDSMKWMCENQLFNGLLTKRVKSAKRVKSDIA